MYPFSFKEFLHANDEDLLLSAYLNASPEKPLNEIVHNKLLHRFSSFILMGGMPKVVLEYLKTGFKGLSTHSQRFGCVIQR